MGLKAVGSSASAAPSSEAFPVGALFLSAVATDPAVLLGYGTWSALASGKMLVTFDQADANFNTVLGTGGNANVTVTGVVTKPTLTMDAYTPSGNNNVPIFTANVANTTSVSAGTPAGNNNQPVFTGTVANTSAVSAGTPTGNNNQPVFTGSVANTSAITHNHELPFIIQSNTVVRVLAQSVFGSGTSRASAGNFNTGASSTSGNVAITQAITHNHNVTATGNVSTPVFTGTALGTHNHNMTATGTVSAPVFTGTALAGHNHNVTVTGVVSTAVFTGDAANLTGNVSQPTFAANDAIILNPYIVIYAWRRTA